MYLNIDDTFTAELKSDPEIQNSRRQVLDACYSFVQPRKPSNPTLLHISEDTANLIGFKKEDLKSSEFLSIFSGNSIYPQTKPFAMNYGGHQFGTWAGQLGDGRAINLFEVLHENQRWAIQLKGAGETPYSRNADGLAVLRSSIREHLCSEAMHYLGVPTTRSLSLIKSGDMVLRDMLYNGNQAYEQGAVVCRVAPTFIRFGNFEILAARNDLKNLTALTDYTMNHFFPTIQVGTKEGYLQFLKSVVEKTFEMIIHWQRVGFVHGVMNTDNMSIIGCTIDYGPYGWMDNYDPNWTPNTTDSNYKRYRFGNQPNIALWNLNQFANAIFPLINDIEPIVKILEDARDLFPNQYLKMMQSKIGLSNESIDDSMLLSNLENLLVGSNMDMTIFYRNLSAVSKYSDNIPSLVNSFEAFTYDLSTFNSHRKSWENWFSDYILRLQKESQSDNERKSKMDMVNPKYVLRNYMAQLVIDAAEKGDYQILNEIFELLKYPYEEQPNKEKWFDKRPDWAMNKVGCSMLSCSS